MSEDADTPHPPTAARRVLSSAIDEHTLLCETCGYPIEGLEGISCPECGRATATSVPAHRLGSPWQRRRGLFSWARTAWGTLRRPTEMFDRVRIERGGSVLALINMLIAAQLFVLPWIGVLIGDPARGARGRSLMVFLATYAWVYAAEVTAVVLVLLSLTWVEYLGVRFFAARRGWRLTRAGAWQVCAHATVGWIVCALMPLLTLALFFSVQRFTGWTPRGELNLGRYGSFPWYGIVTGGGLIVALVLGVTAFEWLVYIGVRRCKYAATAPDAAAPNTAQANAHPGPHSRGGVPSPSIDSPQG